MRTETMTRVEEIQQAVKEGKAFIDSGYGKHYITEYTYSGLVTFAEDGCQSTHVYGTGRIGIDKE